MKIFLKQHANLGINEIKGGTEVWSEFQDAFREMDKYRAMVVKRSEDTARTIAYSIFKAKNDSVTKEKLERQKKIVLQEIREKIQEDTLVIKIASGERRVKLNELNYKIDKKQIEVDVPLNVIGTHFVKINLHKKVTWWFVAVEISSINNINDFIIQTLWVPNV